MPKAYLQTKGLVKIYDNRKVVDNVSLTIEQGKIVGILGPNGAGKTTTFRMVVGLIKADSGEIFFNDKSINKLPMYVRARMGISYLPQEATIFRTLSVQDNLKIILEHLKLSNKERKYRLENLLQEMELSHLRNSKAGTLSGGERRRLEIARTLLNSPSFIMLDEPFAAIDPKIVEGLQGMILKLKERDIGILITDHKPRETLSITDHTYIINKGKILKEGNTTDLVADDNVKKLYLGKKFLMPEVQNTIQYEINVKIEEVKQKIKINNYESAIKTLTDLIGTNNQNFDFFYQRGSCFYKLGDFNSANFDIQRACELNPENLPAQKLLEEIKAAR